MSKQQIIERMLNPGVVAVIRADSSEQLMDVAKALEAGGVTAMEVTMTTPNAIDVIRAVRQEMGDRVLMGVGTVLDTETCRAALLAGAQFVVTPVLKPDVIALCNRYSVPIVAGAYTPTEALTAHEAGADFIKIFPADGLGPGYIKALKAPLPQLQIIPTGGVDVDTAGEFIKAGCAAVAAGGSLVGKDVLKSRDWAKLTETARAFVRAVAAARGK
ncbi:MAG TPA: bifunctional 4-hydroxy-2-oxoglutarate aldolase/2-dehydro-3-deoxy-phosphogluconate aldolase [Armatimonadaceae bacterium]|jgi:2-dehydro-3-deoxyphosphogluconate aldolase/(4S)-4-hydroxy-2-oxoglutarate aldolase|nr:bifunctional 4-hydroxy-2-oxoglutarate aldolase/2-dehydro-3-deoxy-phosphogluconate aldolase [Armatimonadaceae bacterium]